MGKAARGEDGWVFPWGNEPAGWMKSNIVHPGSKRGFKYPPLANVNRYDKGVSLYGIYQMAGNVSEWAADCSTRSITSEACWTTRRSWWPANLKYFAVGPGMKTLKSRDLQGVMPAPRIVKVI